jgi:hypothetical protein
MMSRDRRVTLRTASAWTVVPTTGWNTIAPDAEAISHDHRQAASKAAIVEVQKRVYGATFVELLRSL